jgi:hypothetical protein
MSKDSGFTVGSAVRLPRPGSSKSSSTGRATLATFEDDPRLVSVIWDPLAPQPLPATRYLRQQQEGIPNKNNNNKRRLKRPFLVVPVLAQQDTEEDDETTTVVEISTLEPLEEFEHQQQQDHGGDFPPSATTWKKWGDELLRRGDASAACSYYETALTFTSILQVGSAVLVKLGNGPAVKVADVDVLGEEDELDEAIEVSMVDTGEEKVIHERDIVLCVLYRDEENHWQERILLNLARCLLQLAEVVQSKHHRSSSETLLDHRPRYLRSAVLATTLALTLAEYYHEQQQQQDIHNNSTNNNSLTSLEISALLLQSQAHAGLTKFQNALADIKRVLKHDRNHKEGLKQWQRLQQQQQNHKKVEKKLIKSICQWVQTATKADDDEDPVSDHVGAAAFHHESSTAQRRSALATWNFSKNDTTSSANNIFCKPPPQYCRFLTLGMLLSFLVVLIALLVKM